MRCVSVHRRWRWVVASSVVAWLALNPAEPDCGLATAPDGKSATWDTESSGYADVYLKESASVALEQVTLHVGNAIWHAGL
jgi:hypothetical protein